ncbi:MAG: winged helix-turn-helix domain-containing protein [Clostridiales bacterium]|jgi:transposase|nr:winged helix-turn-helix domain-containing protein [Clostridiales bacterium]MDR2752174.1 winged helix-turn-helix domain-containing protein [Clostridiales bacterium]
MGKTERTDGDNEKPNKIDGVLLISMILKSLQIFMCETLAKRIVGLVLLAAGTPVQQISELTGLSKSSIFNFRKQVINGEMDELFEVGGGGRKSSLYGIEDAILAEVAKGGYTTRQEIVDMIKEKFSISVSVSTVGKLLKKKNKTS